MTMQEVIENELKCVQRDCCRLENECAKCDLVLPKEEIINAYNKALKLEKENAELKSLKDVADLIRLNNSSVVAMAQLNNNNVALRKENAELKEKWQENDKAWWEGFNTCKEKCGSRNVELTDNFTKATKIIKELLFIYYDPLTTESDVKHHHKILADARQFLKDSEVH